MLPFTAMARNSKIILGPLTEGPYRTKNASVIKPDVCLGICKYARVGEKLLFPVIPKIIA